MQTPKWPSESPQMLEASPSMERSRDLKKEKEPASEKDEPSSISTPGFSVSCACLVDGAPKDALGHQCDVRLFQRWKDRGWSEPPSGAENLVPGHSLPIWPGTTGHRKDLDLKAAKHVASREQAGTVQAAGVCVCVCVCVCVARECEQWEWKAMGKGQIWKPNWLRSFGRPDCGAVTARKSQPSGGSSAHRGRAWRGRGQESEVRTLSTRLCEQMRGL